MEIKEFLKENKLWHKFIDKPETIHTIDAAKEAGIDLQKVTKSLVLLDKDKNCILAIIPGNCKLSFEKVKKSLNLKKIRMVPFEEAQDYSGYLPGATPMICHKERMRAVIDEKLLKFESIYGGGGTREKLLELKTTDVIKINTATVANITE